MVTQNYTYTIKSEKKKNIPQQNIGFPHEFTYKNFITRSVVDPVSIIDRKHRSEKNQNNNRKVITETKTVETFQHFSNNSAHMHTHKIDWLSIYTI